uniref:Uncharacterized protein n=2 Tax=Caenorhabditis japonica TaxID=281687 RepID=A0A8R1HJ19_CAEJA
MKQVKPPCGAYRFVYEQVDTNNNRVTIELANTPDGAAKQLHRKRFYGDGMGRYASDMFLVKPNTDPYLVRVGGEALTIPCVVQPEYFNQEKYEINWAQYNNGHLRILTKNDKILSKKKTRFILHSDSKTGNYSLTITEIDKINVEGSYHCNVIATDDDDVQNSAIAKVIVLVPPGDPSIIIDPADKIIEGDFVSAKCVSTGGNPYPKFSWKLPNDTSASSSIFNTFEKDGTVESILHFRVSAEDNEKYIECSVKNEAITEEEVKTTKSRELVVFYKPIIDISPSENLTHLSVEEGNYVNLTCNGRANPAVHSYEWKHLQLEERYQGKVWPFKVHKSMNGDIECKAVNEIGETRSTLTLIVQHAPKVTVPMEYSPNELEDVNIACQVNAVPEAVEIKWVGPNNFKQDGAHLSLRSINSEQTGNYTCISTNFLTIYGHSGSQQRSGSGTVFINVKRKPGNAQVINERTSVDIGNTITLKCLTQDAGNPEATYLWSSPASGGLYGLEEHTSQLFIIRNAQLSDNGNYSCKAHNEIGEGQQSTVHITVIERAKISNSLATEQVFTSGERNKTLECEAQGYPKPTVFWLKDGKPLKNKPYAKMIELESQCSQEDFCTRTVKSTLTLPEQLDWTDKGNFTCVTENGSPNDKKFDSSWTVLRVLHKPVILKKRLPEKLLAAADIGLSATLKCRVSARPEPEIQWTFKGSQLMESEKYSLQTVALNDMPDEHEQLLRIKNVQEEDFGDYTCYAVNDNGEDSAQIELQKASNPVLPTNFEKLSSTPNSISLGWTPQFDGGFNQTFVIEVRKIDPFTGEIDSNQKTMLFNVSKIKLEEEYEADGTIISKNTFDFTGLTPLSTYVLRMKATNEKGSSKFTQAIFASTEDVVEDSIIMSPIKLTFDSSKMNIDIEPKLPADACTLLYVFHNGIWRSSHCYNSNEPISNVPNGRKYKARFCLFNQSLKCSYVSPVIEAKYKSSWKSSTTFFILLFTFVGLSLLTFVFVCCKTRSTPKELKLTPIVVSSFSDERKKSKAVYAPCVNREVTSQSQNQFTEETNDKNAIIGKSE